MLIEESRYSAQKGPIGRVTGHPGSCDANVFCFVDDAHAATEFFDDAAMGDSLADEGVGVSHSAAILDCTCAASQRRGLDCTRMSEF